MEENCNVIESNIPKVIHYCWFGGNSLSEQALKCIASWRRYCPDYEIKEWNESNFDYKSCDYAREAYEVGKWAFVSDYARFKILYEYGGLYFDTDVELIKPIDDIVERGSFMGREDYPDGKYKINVAPGLGLAANPGLDLYREIIEHYEEMHFKNNDGSINYKTVVEYITEILVNHGLTEENKIQRIEGVYIYPHDYFCPLNYETMQLHITQNTYSIHHYDASWHSEEEKYKQNLERKLERYFGKNVGYICAFIGAVKYRGVISAVRDIKDWIYERNERKITSEK